jgi:hypothetical protein
MWLGPIPPKPVNDHFNAALVEFPVLKLRDRLVPSRSRKWQAGTESSGTDVILGEALGAEKNEYAVNAPTHGNLQGSGL